VAFVLLFAASFQLPVLADDEDDNTVERLGREIAAQFVADYFGEHSAEHDLFVSSAKKDLIRFASSANKAGIHDLPADGQVITFYDDEISVMVSITLGRVMSLDFRGLDRKSECTPDDERALAPDHEHFVADVQRFLDATASEVKLASLAPKPHESLCMGGGPFSRHSWSELPDEEGVYSRWTRVEVRFNLFTKQIHGFMVQTMTWDDAIKVDTEDCRRIVTSMYGDRPGFEISHMAMIRVFPFEGPPYPTWVVSFDADPLVVSGLTIAGMGATVKIHALTGEVVKDFREYKAQPSDPNR